MEYLVEKRNIVINRASDFDIEHILECGQCFRFYKIGEKRYRIIAHGRILEVSQTLKEVVFHHTTEEDLHHIWWSYFDLDRDYTMIKHKLGKMNNHLHLAVTEKSGIRLLQQDIWETLVSFIISQNKHITHIKKLIEDLSNAYGTYIGTVDGVKYFSFPTVEQLSHAVEEDLRRLKVGFRAPYIVDAYKKILDGEVGMKALMHMPLEDAKKELMKIKGVGPKVADCVLLFGARRYEVFPVDVWVKRVMEYFYFNKDTKITHIHDYAIKEYGHLAGFAQQYLFYYARDFQIGKKKK